jgi:hypothetical protein
MKILLYFTFAIVSLVALGSCSITSGLMVPAGQTFYLGGGQKGAYTANATNTGTVPVALLLKASGAEPTLVTTLMPGKSTKARVPALAALLIRNEGDKDANVTIKAPGRVANLSMGYK